MNLPLRKLSLVSLTMVAFAGNSLLCRLALKTTSIDPGSFTSIRLFSGALTLWLLFRWRASSRPLSGNWSSAFVLFVYAAGFSYAYINLPASVGALLLFAAVQGTMIGYGLWTGEKLTGRQALGLGLAFVGLIGLLLQEFSSPSPLSSLLMLSAGVAWGIYSLRGKGGGDPLSATAGNFIRALPFAALLSGATSLNLSLDISGVGYAVASGALASGLGYALWYAVVPILSATSAASVQLSVPVIAAIGGVLLLDESMTFRLLLSSVAILCGIALVTMPRSLSPEKESRAAADRL